MILGVKGLLALRIFLCETMESMCYSFKIDSFRREIKIIVIEKRLAFSLLLKLAYYHSLGTLLELSNRMTAGRY